MSGRRFEFDGTVEEKGGQQFVSGRGLFGQGFTRVHRPEPHGFASVPVKGAKGLLLSPNAESDEAFVLGGEHGSHRPQGLPAGGAALYDAHGNVLKVVMGDGIVVDVAGSGYVIRKGGVTVTIDASGLHVDGGGIWNDGVPVDKTHIHSGVEPGGATTSTPVG